MVPKYANAHSTIRYQSEPVTRHQCQNHCNSSYNQTILTRGACSSYSIGKPAINYGILLHFEGTSYTLNSVEITRVTSKLERYLHECKQLILSTEASPWKAKLIATSCHRGNQSLAKREDYLRPRGPWLVLVHSEHLFWRHWLGPRLGAVFQTEVQENVANLLSVCCFCRDGKLDSIDLFILTKVNVFLDYLQYQCDFIRNLNVYPKVYSERA